MTRRSPTDEQLAPMIREVLAEMIDDLPPTSIDVPSTGDGLVEPHRSTSRAASRFVALAAACVVLVSGLAFVASRRGNESGTTAPPPPTSTVGIAPSGSAPVPWANGVRMIVYIAAESSDDSLQFVRDHLSRLSNIVDADGIRYLGPQESLDEARRLLVDDPTTLDLLTVENIPTAFYITPNDGVTYDDLLGVAASIEVLPEVIRVDVDPDGRAPIPGIPQQPDSGPSTSDDVTSPNTTQPADVLVEVPLAPGAWDGARTSANGESLLLFFVGAAEYQPDDPCSMRYLPTVQETNTEVNVTIHGERPRASDGSESFGCRAIGYSRVVTVELSQPFGDRRLIVLGAERDVFDGATLSQPQWIPDGWKAGLEQPAELGDDPAAAWARTWAPPRSEPRDGACVPGNNGFTLFEGGAEIVDVFPAEPGETEINTYDIDGHTATYSTQADIGITRLSWVNGDRGYVLKSFPNCAGDEPPPLDTMLQFARELNP